MMIDEKRQKRNSALNNEKRPRRWFFSSFIIHHSSFLLLLLATLPGCAWLQARTAVGPPAPRVLAEEATLGQVLDAVNRNTAGVASYQTNSARLTLSGAPPLRTDIAVVRPRNFRLRAETALTGPEVDLGSNADLFWFWVRRAEPPGMYFCRHDRFAGSAARQFMPVDPQWLIEALGLVTFDPAGQHSQPVPVRGNRLEIRSRIPSPEGDLMKITLVDAGRAWVLEQHIYTAAGERLASAIAKEHRYYPAYNVSLPQHIEVQVPRAQLIMHIDVGNVAINSLPLDRQELFARPVYPGFAEVDLSGPPPGSQPMQSSLLNRPASVPTRIPPSAPAAITPPSTPWQSR